MANRGYPLAVDEDTAFRMLRIKIARETGWTLEYIDEMSIRDVGDLVATFEGESKAAARR